jgi:fibronectin-binding autotransporter adhesin
MKTIRIAVASVLAFSSAHLLQAQLTWDPALDGGITGGAGPWDNTTANWWDGANDVSWVNSSDAVFGGTGGLVTIGSGASLTVNDLTLNAGVGTYTIMAAVDNEGISVDPGAVWSLNDNELEFVGDQVNDTKLTLSSAGTLTITGSGTFDAGEKPNGATWAVGGSTLDFQAVTLRGTRDNIGQFSTVKMADASTYIHERNTDRAYANDWVLNGTVNFDNRYARNYTLNGVVSDGTSPGTLVVSGLEGKYLRLNNTGNTFSGGIVVDGSASEVQNTAGDGAFGAVPGLVDPDYIRLKNSGELKMNGITIDPNRGITLENGGTIINTGNANTYGGTITGDGGLQIGRDAGADGNTLILTSNTSDYTGGTRIYQGSITLGIDGALPTDTLLTIGGKGNSLLFMEGYNQQIGGLESVGGNTREIRNATDQDSVLTIHVADGEDYNYGSNFDDRAGGSTAGNLSIVKTGLGTQRLTKSGSINGFHGTVSVDEGTLIVNNDGFSSVTGTWTVNSGGTFGGNGILGVTLDVNGGTLAPGTSPDTLTVAGLLLDPASILEYELNGLDATVGGGINDLTVVNGGLTLDGTLNVSELGSFAGVTSGSWTLFQYTGALNDNGLELGTLPALEPGYEFAIDTTSSSTDVLLTIQVIPEPSTFALGGLGLAVLLIFRRRR